MMIMMTKFAPAVSTHKRTLTRSLDNLTVVSGGPPQHNTNMTRNCRLYIATGQDTYKKAAYDWFMKHYKEEDGPGVWDNFGASAARWALRNSEAPPAHLEIFVL